MTDTTSGPVELTVAGRECVVFGAGPDGEELVCTLGPDRPVHPPGDGWDPISTP
ncbi:hypothetical protein ACJEDT_02880 [Rhodococcoides fascians]|uniref:hypothetical protein n=1 Tax=Rhodococcoides fascians TaxID=1828 RepID=UPI0012D2B6A2|nr:hypothetical protein [Rhodococcus fascians]